MELTIHQVDAFTNRLLCGNPAAVILLEAWLDDALLQAIARENNLSETVFVVRETDDYRIRWFTPSVEVDLCGHGTLAAAHVMFGKGMVEGDTLHLLSRSGPLSVRKDGHRFVLDFPAEPLRRIEPDPQVGEALGTMPCELFAGRYVLAVYASLPEVAALSPDFTKMSALDALAVIATAPGEECDFVSRFFGPRVGVPEDPVTGSAHCLLVPYWSRRLGKAKLHARQISPRGGELFCVDHGGRVHIGGHAVEYLVGRIQIPLSWSGP